MLKIERLNEIVSLSSNKQSLLILLKSVDEDALTNIVNEVLSFPYHTDIIKLETVVGFTRRFKDYVDDMTLASLANNPSVINIILVCLLKLVSAYNRTFHSTFSNPTPKAVSNLFNLLIRINPIPVK